jgi:hypothetical protein
MGPFLECSPPFVEARVRFPAGIKNKIIVEKYGHWKKRAGDRGSACTKEEMEKAS